MRRRMPVPFLRAVSAGAGTAAAAAAVGWVLILVLLTGLAIGGWVNLALQRSWPSALLAVLLTLSILPVLVREWGNRSSVSEHLGHPPQR